MKKPHNYFTFLICFFFLNFSAQNKEWNPKEIQEKYDSIVEQEHNDENFNSIKYLHTASQKIHYEKGILKTSLYLANEYISRNNYNQALDFNSSAEKLALKNNDNESLFAVHNNKSRIYAAQGLESECIKQNFLSLKKAESITNNDIRNYFESVAYQNIATNYSIYEKPQDSILYYMKESIAKAEKISNSKKWILKKNDMLMFLYCNVGNFYTGVHIPRKLNLAEAYYMKALKFREIAPEAFKHSDLDILISIGKFYSEKKDYQKAIAFSNEVLNLEKNKKNPQIRMEAYMNLSNSYRGIKNDAMESEYLKLYVNLKDSLNFSTKNSTNNSIKQIVLKEKEKKSHKLNMIIWVVSGIFIISIICIYFLWRKNMIKIQKKYEKLIKKIKLEKETTQYVEQNIDIKKISSPDIPEETLSGLYDKLNKFEKSDKYLKKGLTISTLAYQMNTNPKYLSKAIKGFSGKSFNDYINGLRIDYISKKLYEDPSYRLYKISHLAELGGFSSREVFTVIFKKETGVNPSYFIKKLTEEFSS